jgi:hypothetical protein
MASIIMYHADHVNPRRPTIITLLAVSDDLVAAFLLGCAVVCLLPEHARSVGFSLLGSLFRSDSLSGLGRLGPSSLALICLLLAVPYGLIGIGLWKLRNWARVVTIVLTVPISGTLPSALGVINGFFPVPVPYLLGYVLSFMLFLYLVSPGVRTVFGVTAARRKWLIPAVSTLVLSCLIYDLYRSDREFDAMRWHMRNGDRVSVNGVTFPVYYWYEPVQERSERGFTISDEPGPLRKRDAFAARISVKSDADVTRTSSVGQRIDDEIRGYTRSGYTDVDRFQLRVAGQTLACMRTSDVVTHHIDCYGDGPISSVSFVGGNRSLDRFQRMMAEAR